MKKRSKLLCGLLAGLPALYLFSIAPGRRSLPLMDRLKKYDYAHRGLHNNLWKIPENSMAAFKEAIDHHYGIELDVHLTKDKHLVVFHDDSLWRMCRVKGKICDMTWNELKDIPLIGTTETIPLFKDVLALVAGQVPLIIELKVDNENYNELCTAVDHLLVSYKGEYCIESFHPLALYWYRKHRKKVIRGQLSCNFRKSPRYWQLKPLALSHLLTNVITRPDFIAYDYEDIQNWGFFLNRRLFGAMTVLWTIRHPKDYKVLKKLGHTIIFEQFTP